MENTVTSRASQEFFGGEKRPPEIRLRSQAIMNLDVAYLKFAWNLQKATCTLNIKWVGELVPSVR